MEENPLYCATAWLWLDEETVRTFDGDPLSFDFAMFNKADLSTPEIAEWN